MPTHRQAARGLAGALMSAPARKQHRDGLELKLQQGGAMHGRVSGLMPGERGRTQIQVAGESFALSATVAEDGSYSLVRVPAGPATAVAKTPLDRELLRPVNMSEQKDIAMNFEFPAGFRLSGNVRRGGSAMRFAQITAVPVSDSLVRGAGETNPAGQYVIQGLSEGSYIVKVRGSGQAVAIDLTSDMQLDFDLPPR